MEVLAVAMDAQGPDKPRPYVQRANPAYTNAVDEANLLGQLYGFKAIPNGLLIDEEGILRYMKFGGFDVRKPDTAKLVSEWAKATASQDLASEVDEKAPGTEHLQAIALFQEGLGLYREGLVAEALVKWKAGMALEPDNLVIRKQIWAVEHPERFYASDKVDYAWQREQMEKGI